MVLVTGGAGFIGSHTCVQLLEKGYGVVVVDSLVNSHGESLERVMRIAGKKLCFVEADVRDRAVLRDIFAKYEIDSVIHFAGLKAVGESVAKPLEYYSCNIDSTLVLLEEMNAAGVKNFVFSSSATVYSAGNEMPLKENSSTGNCTNPYGWTKFMQEQMLKSLCTADSEMSVVLLRYFNPVGAHQSGLIGEDPQGVPNNLLPYVSQVAVGRLKCLTVHGDDYDTPDGTGVRDYIHVCDLAAGHVAAINYMQYHKGENVFNLGTGTGYSVLDLVNTFMRVTGVNIPYEFAPRRPGDLASVYSSSDKSAKELGWRAVFTLEDMCRDTWAWQSRNPMGYDS